MATVKKSTTKAPAKKAAKKAVTTPPPFDMSALGDMIAGAVEKANQPLLDRVAALEKTSAPTKPAAVKHAPGGKRVEEELLETIPVMPEEAAGWTEEQIEAFNKREQAKMRARKRAQAENRKDLETMGTAERMRKMMAPRDPDLTRMALPPDWDGDEDALVKVRCLRRVGLNESGDMSDLDEEVLMPPENARTLQRTGAVEVVI